jgi:hypothetical protein
MSTLTLHNKMRKLSLRFEIINKRHDFILCSGFHQGCSPRRNDNFLIFSPCRESRRKPDPALPRDRSKALRLHPWRLGSDSLRLLQRWGQFIEIDNSSFGTDPEHPEVLEVMSTLCRIQIENGGAPYIGRRIFQLFSEAGFSGVDVHHLDLRGDESDTFVLGGLTTVFANIFESVEQTLGPEMGSRIRSAASRLRNLPLIKGCKIFYSPAVCRGKVEA